MKKHQIEDLVSQRSISGISLRDPAERVEKKLGRPPQVDLESGEIWKWDDLEIRFVQGIVSEIILSLNGSTKVAIRGNVMDIAVDIETLRALLQSEGIFADVRSDLAIDDSHYLVINNTLGIFWSENPFSNEKFLESIRLFNYE